MFIVYLQKKKIVITKTSAFVEMLYAFLMKNIEHALLLIWCLYDEILSSTSTLIVMSSKTQ